MKEKFLSKEKKMIINLKFNNENSSFVPLSSSHSYSELFIPFNMEKSLSFYTATSSLRAAAAGKVVMTQTTTTTTTRTS